MRDAVICEPLRTPVGRYGGVFRDVPAANLDATGEPFKPEQKNWKPGRPPNTPVATDPAPAPTPAPASPAAAFVTPEPSSPPGTAQPGPEPKETHSGPVPDFSDLPPDESGGPAGASPGAQSPIDAAKMAESHRSVSTFVWDTIVQLLATIFGMEWMPRKMGNGPGELPYDEREMVINAFVDYFAWVGLMLLNPLHRLWIALGSYSLPRTFTFVRWLKTRRMKKANATETTAQPAPPEPKPETSQPTEATIA